MEITLYPAFDDVFENNVLKGIFYPLCKVSGTAYGSFFFVSHNGIWTDDKVNHHDNQFKFTCFSRKNGKYQFNGTTALYCGYENAKAVFEILTNDFKQNGNAYQAQKLKTALYIKKMTSHRTIDFGKLDANYYLEAFYQFSMNKLIYETSGQFGAFQERMYGYGKAEKSPIVYEIKNDYSCGYADIEANKEVLFPKSMAIETYAKIGCVVGSEFFADGNDIYVLFDAKNDSVINIHHYS